MKNWFPAIPVVMLLLFNSPFTFAQNEKKCCDDAGCRTTAMRYAVKLTGLVAYLPKHNSDPGKNQRALDSLNQANNPVFLDFMQTAKEAHSYFYGINAQFRNDGCFTEAMPTDSKSNVQLWVTFVGNIGTTPKFPSAEFCSGVKIRIELGQGATDIGRNTTAYLGSFQAFLTYTPGKKDACGNKFRIMAGPAIFFRGSTSYVALSSRVALRIKDIRPAFFPLGNINLFGSYSTSFGNLSYAGIGGEVELGFLGFNISGNNNLKTGKKGFAVNIFYIF